MKVSWRREFQQSGLRISSHRAAHVDGADTKSTCVTTATSANNLNAARRQLKRQQLTITQIVTLFTAFVSECVRA